MTDGSGPSGGGGLLPGAVEKVQAVESTLTAYPLNDAGAEPVET